MLNFLQTGAVLYVLAAVCLLGMVSKITAGSIYKRWIRETSNMALTKNRSLRGLKQKAEDTYRLNQGMSNTRVYLERQFYDMKLGMMKPDRWAAFGSQMTWGCFLIGGLAAFLSYWYRSDTYYIVLYGSMGIVAGILNMIVDSGVNLAEKRNHFLVSMEDYLVNSLFRRMERDFSSQEADVQEEEEDREEAQKLENMRNGIRSFSRERERRAGRKGLEQTAASRDKGREKVKEKLSGAQTEKSALGENWMKDLKPEDLKVLGDIVKEYLG